MEETKNIVDFADIIGSSWWITIQMLYLLSKYSENECVFLPASFNVETRDYDKHIQISNQYNLLWHYEEKNNKFKLSAPLQLTFPQYIDLLSECVESSKRFSIIPIGLVYRGIGHANMLIYDKKEKTLERFEPHGTTPQYYRSEFLDKVLEAFFKKFIIKEEFIYTPPYNFCPRDGPQILEEISRKKLGINFKSEKSGLCSVWSFIYTNLRLENTNKTNKEIVNYILNKSLEIYPYIENIILSLYSLSLKLKNASTDEDIVKILKETVININ